ncbi:hypothetical protein DTO164E3_34 [Paecilomyces variotii]|nr:hypothetical protein DTO032I3_3083 [Paecilomyces variotii]KAJ9207748.1 hypothetical protein DTO164E3_34 [Paecilomyces variotii]KAJ9227557.1 hypothetical protein DTO169C6_198 [Paecilomyces variotii]KAJ9245974.1 hypothetical protein DTO169E5_98 [Paecilomyces variotii]KAJ9246372.1 hypothetical protein DTO207G8_9026 [Paecilomyces variotii]
MGYEASSVPDDLPFHTHGYRTLPTDGPRDRIYGIGSEVLALEYHIYMTGMQLRATSEAVKISDAFLQPVLEPEANHHVLNCRAILHY